MTAAMDRNDLDEVDRLIDEQREEDAATKPPKPFVHKEYPFRCPGCQLAVRVGERLVCQGTGRTVSTDSYPVTCAHLPIERPEA